MNELGLRVSWTPKTTIAALPSGALQRRCGDCRTPREATLQRAAVRPSRVDDVPPIVHEVLRSAGQPMDPAARAYMEPRFGHDFSRVRVHTDAQADASARAIHALAYTSGQHIVFKGGQYLPAATAGRRILAHELTHVVQQSTGQVAPGDSICDPDERLEQAAHQTARQAEGYAPGHASRAIHAAPQAIQRQVEVEDEEENRPRVVIDESDHFRPASAVELEESEEAARPLQRLRDSAPGAVIQRQGIPPPPTVFPHFSEWYFDVAADMVDQFAFTCKDRWERGFFVMWNEETKKSFAGPRVQSEVEGKIDLGPMPSDREPIFPVGWFHTHPRPKPGFLQVGVGPSERDEKTSAELKIPGAVMDFSKPGVNDCTKASTFFFGPGKRPPK